MIPVSALSHLVHYTVFTINMKFQLTVLLLASAIALCYAAEKQQCCPNGEIIIGQGKCGTGNDTVRMSCKAGKIVLRDIILNGDKVSTQDTPNYIFVEDVKLYCVGQMYRNKTHPELGLVPIAVVCFDTLAQTSDIETSGILTLISVFFLVATLAIYTFLPQMRDLQGLCYMCMCISMAIGFLSLGILQLSPGFRGEICTITGFLVYAWMIATFFWMNVICINVYRNVLDATYLKKTERRQFFIYSCYAWGATLLFLVIAVITNSVEGDHWKPGIGQGSCWFNGRTETWIFFSGPVGIIISSNIILFLLSSYNLWKQTMKYEVNTLNNLKNKFLLSLKLFLVMGISWIFEIASFAHGESHIIWKIMDIFNCLQGVVIFILLVVLRKRVIQVLADENILPKITRPWANRLSPDDDSDDQEILADDTTEVKLN